MTRKTRRPGRSSVTQIDNYTLVDALMASPTEPAPAHVHADRIAAAEQALQRLRSTDTATVTDWSLVCMVGNVLETMLTQGLAADPDGLLQDAFDALRRAAQLVRAPGEPISIPGADFASVAGMVADWADLLRHAPARAVIRAFRSTHARVLEIEAGRPKPHDFHIAGGQAQAVTL